jgi:hypothetical protein
MMVAVCGTLRVTSHVTMSNRMPTLAEAFITMVTKICSTLACVHQT